MISFKVIHDGNEDSVIESLGADLSEDGASYLSEIVYGLCDDGDMEYAVSVFACCALVRIFDMGRYIFLFPCELCEDADPSAAIKAVTEYAMREELPIIFADVPPEYLGCFAGYRHMDIDAEDAECTSYRVRIKTECDLIDEIPKAEWGRVTLSELSDSDSELYDELCRNDEVNRFWGYDYREDEKVPESGYFLGNARLEFARGVSVTVAARENGEFIGEATLYAFDGMGGAEFSVRLLPKKQGNGLGTETVLAIEELARKMGLLRLTPRVMRENLPSVAMMKKVTDNYTEDDRFAYFIIEL